MLGERSYPPNGTETQEYHQISACRTRHEGYDTASYRCGIGKATALMVLMGGHHLIELDQHVADEDKLTSKAPSLLHVTDPQFKEI